MWRDAMADPTQIPDADWETGKAAGLAYGGARKAFRDAQAQLPLLLCGNDNKVGIAGEFWAKSHYVGLGYRISETPHSSNEGYDFACSKDGRVIRVSVKVVSDESKTGRQLRLKESERWDELLLVRLDEHLRPYLIGRATRAHFDQAVADGKIGRRPFVSKYWAGLKGWMSVYGEVTRI